MSIGSFRMVVDRSPGDSGKRTTYRFGVTYAPACRAAVIDVLRDIDLGTGVFAALAKMIKRRPDNNGAREFYFTDFDAWGWDTGILPPDRLRAHLVDAGLRDVSEAR